MTLTLELASFTVREGAEQEMLAERQAMIEALAEAFPGVLAAWLGKRADGSWVDVILWQTSEQAEHSAEHVQEVGEVSAWFRHIASSQGLQHVQIAHQQLFGFEPR
jgi:hypothetical protein